MITTRHLFIGGPNDEDRLLVQGNHPTIKVPHLNEGTELVHGSVYRRSLFGSSAKRFEVFVHESTDPEDVIGMLIEHYKP